MLPVQKRVSKIQVSGLIFHSGIMGHRRITITQKNILNPSWNNTFCIHQISNRFQNCFEVIFLLQFRQQIIPGRVIRIRTDPNRDGPEPSWTVTKLSFALRLKIRLNDL